MGIPVTHGDQAMRLEAIVTDEATFRAWYDAVLPRVYRYLLSRCGHDVALAEELTQQTFVEAIRRRRQFDGRSDAVTWLCAIGRNKLVDHFRRTGRDQRRQLRLLDGGNDPGISWEAAEIRQSVETTLDRLSAEQRLVLVFRYLDGLSVREIAAAIGRSESGTESVLVRAREAFRRAYGGDLDA
ncbi:MAG: RNA polymerase sigma factor [Chloroflexota bacterium]